MHAEIMNRSRVVVHGDSGSHAEWDEPPQIDGSRVQWAADEARFILGHIFDADLKSAQPAILGTGLRGGSADLRGRRDDPHRKGCRYDPSRPETAQTLVSSLQVP